MSAKNITFYPSPNAELNSTQLEVLAHAANGSTAKIIARELDKSPATVISHLNTARAFYRAVNATHAVAIAIASGDIEFKLNSSHNPASRFSAIAFALIAGIACIQDTPFITDVDHSIVRHTRTLRSQHGRNNQRDNALDIA